MARAIALSSTALLGAVMLAWAPQPATGWDQAAAEATLWQLLNGDRTNNGIAPIAQHGTLVSLARWRSKDMVDRDYFNHTILGTNYQVYHWYDANGLSWNSGGENIGYNNGFSDADSPVKINEGFMASDGHRANILNPAWTHGGVGAYGADGVMWGGSVRNIRMYTELFMQAKSAPPPPPPPPAATPVPPPPAPVATPVPVVKPPAPVSTPRQQPLTTATATPVPTPTMTPEPTATPAPKGPALIATIHSTVGDDAPWMDAMVARSLRVETSVRTSRGIFETVIGSLLNFFLG
jgi:uncharacterized protein YkwD